MSAPNAAVTIGTRASGVPTPVALAIALNKVALCLANWSEVISKQWNSSGTWASADGHQPRLSIPRTQEKDTGFDLRMGQLKNRALVYDEFHFY